MRVIEFLEENRSSLRVGLPIELLDLVDERTVYAGNYEGLMEALDMIGLEHVRNARFVMDGSEYGSGRIVLLYMKDLDKYDDFDLRQFAIKMKRLEMRELSLEEKLSGASARSACSACVEVGCEETEKI